MWICVFVRMKVLDEYILILLYLLLLTRVHCLANEPKGVSTQMKAPGEYILMVMFALMKTFHFLAN